MLRNFVLETANAPGTSATVNLAGAATGRRSFAAAFATGTVAHYFMDDGTQAEWGRGTVTFGSPTTLSRDTVIGNTAGTTARLNFTGSVRVYNEAYAESLMVSDLYPDFSWSAPANILLYAASTIAMTSTGDMNLYAGTQLSLYTASYRRMYIDNAGQIIFVYAGTTNVGSITVNASSTSFNTTSDRRLKNLFGPHDGAEISRIEVHDAEFIAEPGARRAMLVADQLQAAGAGYAVTGEAGAVDAEGRIVPQMVDHGTLVPALVAYAQGQERRIAALERRIAALEANGRVGVTHVTDITPKT